MWNSLHLRTGRWMSYREIILKSPQNKNYNVRVVRTTKEKRIYTYMCWQENAWENTVCVFIWLGFFQIKMLFGKYSEWEFLFWHQGGCIWAPIAEHRGTTDRGQGVKCGYLQSALLTACTRHVVWILPTFPGCLIHLLWQAARRPCCSSARLHHFLLASVSTMWNGTNTTCWMTLTKVKRPVFIWGVGVRWAQEWTTYRCMDRKWDISRCMLLISGASSTFQMLFGEGKVGIKGNLQLMEIFFLIFNLPLLGWNIVNKNKGHIQ